MKLNLKPLIAACVLTAASMTAFADFFSDLRSVSQQAAKNAEIDTANAARKKENAASALKQITQLAEGGSPENQFILGVIYHNGQGVGQDYTESVKWYRLAANRGQSTAQSNLGSMYQYGQSVASSKVVAYALYNLSASIDPSTDNKAPNNRAAMASEMTPKMLDAAQALTNEMSKPGNMLKALDAYIKNHRAK
jgi:TPR repeat protein